MNLTAPKQQREERPVNLYAEVGPLTATAFTFDPSAFFRRACLAQGWQLPVRLGGRALDILTALVANSATLISKDDLISYAWPRVRVEEANLRAPYQALCVSALGENPGGRTIYRYRRRARILLCGPRPVAKAHRQSQRRRQSGAPLSCHS